MPILAYSPKEDFIGDFCEILGRKDYIRSIHTMSLEYSY